MRKIRPAFVNNKNNNKENNIEKNIFIQTIVTKNN